MDFYIGPLPFSIQTHVILNINLTNLLKVLGLTNNKFLDGMVFLSWIIDELLEAKAMILIITCFFGLINSYWCLLVLIINFRSVVSFSPQRKQRNRKRIRYKNTPINPL